MSYQVLARKWRPAKFEQMVGQSHVLMALTNALSQQRLHHAYLFTGTRGVGKTSLARLFAKGLNCETGVTANPCGECSSCIEIAQGRFVDLIEVDAASRTKVDDTRELLDNVQYRPSRGRFKVYLIDEVHMLSRSSFNALLKTLEEPPEHVKFLLATTDPHKLPVTVLSRCLQFNLKSLSQDEISKQLEYVITQEQLPFEPQALSLLAKAANGSMRDALSLTDQAIAFGSGQVMLTQVQTMLGSIDEQHVLALLKALCDAEIGPLMQTVAKVLAFGADAEEVLRSLLELLHQITLTQFAPAAAQQSLFSEQILAFAQQLAPEQVQLYYQMLLNGRKDLPFAPDPKSGLEMALLRAVAFTPEKQVKRWVTPHPANIDLTVIDDPSLPAQEVIETGPKSDIQPQIDTNFSDTALPTTALTAPTQTAATLAVDVDVEEDNVVDDELVAPSLAAEQALLLSQAQSQGFDTLTPKNGDKPAEHLAEHLVDHVGGTDSNSDLADTSVSGSDNPSINAETSAEQHLNDKPVSDEIGEQAKPVSSTAAAAEKVPSNDSVVDNSLDAYAFMDYDSSDESSMEYQPFDHDEDIAFSALNEAVEPNNLAEVTDTSSQPQKVSQASDNASQENTDNEDNVDDFLDEVLASRDSLIADVGALQQKDELAKKEPAKTLAPKLTQPVLSPIAVNQTPPEAVEAHELAVSDTGAALPVLPQIGPTQAVVDYDRPPWIAPEEGEQVNTFADVPDTKQSASETMDQPTRTRHQLQQPATAQTRSALIANPLNISPEPAVGASTDEQQQQLVKFEPHSIQGDEVDLHWFKVMTNVSVGGRVRQLGVNSVCPALSNPLVLVLKPNQKHLSAQTAIDQLQVALSEYLEQPTQVQIQIGIVPLRETPLELRKRFHRELIAQAQQSILLDDNVKWMIQRLSAQLDSDSIGYPSEQLGQIAQDIAQISAS